MHNIKFIAVHTQESCLVCVNDGNNHTYATYIEATSNKGIIEEVERKRGSKESINQNIPVVRVGDMISTRDGVVRIESIDEYGAYYDGGLCNFHEILDSLITDDEIYENFIYQKNIWLNDANGVAIKEGDKMQLPNDKGSVVLTVRYIAPSFWLCDDYDNEVFNGKAYFKERVIIQEER